METVFQYQIPALHPLAVHFPVGLLVAALPVSLLWLVGGDRLWRRVATVLLLLGGAGAAFAYLTGEAMHEMSEEVPIVEELVELHEDLALATLIAAIVIVLAALAVEIRRRSLPRDSADPIVLRFVGFVCVLVVSALVLFTGHVGGVMVWGVAH